MTRRTIAVFVAVVLGITGGALVWLHREMQIIATPLESETPPALRWEATPAGPALEELKDAKRVPYRLFDPELGVDYEIEVTPARRERAAPR